MLSYIQEKYNIPPIKQLIRIKANMIFSDTTKKHHTPHVDIPIPHWTIVYYVNDSRGPTHLFNEFYNKQKNTTQKTSLYKTIEPKKGTFILFNGLRYHASSNPNNGYRCIININYV